MPPSRGDSWTNPPICLVSRSKAVRKSGSTSLSTRWTPSHDSDANCATCRVIVFSSSSGTPAVSSRAAFMAPGALAKISSMMSAARLREMPQRTASLASANL
jgi:hypothetical protein